jgi:D-Tyr-tRNAtyr deacylase
MSQVTLCHLAQNWPGRESRRSTSIAGALDAGRRDPRGPAHSARPRRWRRRRTGRTSRGQDRALRIFEDESGKFDRSLLDTRGAALVISQFTLIADSKRQKGTRPSFSDAARPDVAQPLYERFCAELRALGIQVETGLFGAKIQVELVNDGPVTIVLDT